MNFKEFVLFDKVENFPRFRVLYFVPYDEIETSKSLEILSTFANFKAVVLFEEVGNVQGFRVFDFSTRKTRKFFQDL